MKNSFKKGKNMNKKILLLILIVFLVIGVLSFMWVISSFSNQDVIYDSDEHLVKQGDSYTYTVRKGGNKDLETNISGTLTGMETLWRIESDGQFYLNLAYNLELEKGRLKLVLIDPDNSVTTIVEGSHKGHQSIPLKEGRYRIKIVGDSGKGQVFLRLEETQGIRIYSLEN